MSDPYYVCTVCGHYWSSPYVPDDMRCENCSRRGVVTSYRDLDNAEIASQRLVEVRARERLHGGTRP